MKLTSAAIQRMLLFIGVVLGWSFVFFQIRPLIVPEGALYELGFFITWVPALGLLLMSLLLRPRLKIDPLISLLGGSAKWSLLTAALPVLGLAIIGLPNEAGRNPHSMGLFIGLVVWVYALLEEYGWRGYLQQELQLPNEWIRYALIGLVWYLWHWDFLDDPSLKGEMIFLGGLILGSLGIGKIAEKTQSIAVCATVHALANIGFLYGYITRSIPIGHRLGLVAICALGIFLIIRLWDKEKSEA